MTKRPDADELQLAIDVIAAEEREWQDELAGWRDSGETGQAYRADLKLAQLRAVGNWLRHQKKLALAAEQAASR